MPESDTIPPNTANPFEGQLLPLEETQSHDTASPAHDAPSSFCFICTKSSCHELIGMLLSLSMHHPGVKVYGFVDSATNIAISTFQPRLKLDLHLVANLDLYTDKNRRIMEREGIFGDLMTKKAHVVTYALERSSDTFFVDSDILFLGRLDCIDRTKTLGVSPHFIPKRNTDEVGYYNAGCLWTCDKSVPSDWVEFNKTSRYFDQASVEDLASKYDHFEFGEEVNVMPWRMLLNKPGQTEMAKFGVDRANRCVMYNDRPLMFVHTHFDDQRFQVFNTTLRRLLKSIGCYKELAIIDFVLHRKWRLEIPKQPQQPPLFRHANDSFRELAMLLYKNNREHVSLVLTAKPHCYLGEGVLLYDRPTTEWLDQHVRQADVLLLGNGHVQKEGLSVTSRYDTPVLPWTFWPRRPLFVEKHMENEPSRGYSDREMASIFIGNIENNTQHAYRNDTLNWASSVEEYVCTTGSKHKYTQPEYLKRLANARFGLCLRGYGSKCHREVELMALGTVPLVTSDVSIGSYMDPPRENVHFLRVQNPEDVKTVVANISPEKWLEMSNNCQEWYNRNVHSKNALGAFLDYLFYTPYDAGQA